MASHRLSAATDSAASTTSRLLSRKPLVPRHVAYSNANNASAAGAAKELILPHKPKVAAPAPKLIDMSKAGQSGPNMSRRNLLNIGLAALTVAACPCCEPAKAAGGGPAWDYDTEGPAKWQGVCTTGARQSPINLTLSKAQPAGFAFGDIRFKYGPQKEVTVLNTGHGTMQVNFAPGNIARVGGLDLELLQYHFHTPSEHAMDGRRAPMEVHLVHRIVATGNLAVVGVMMEPGAGFPNPAVQMALDFAPAKAQQTMMAVGPVNPMTLLPPVDQSGGRGYIHYGGSLTTPPCTEGVEWFVMKNPIKVPEKQILDFMRFVGQGMTYGYNSRPLMPVNDRGFHYQLD